MRSIIDTTRVSELNFLEQIFNKQGPDIIGLYGIPGIGKSTLVSQFARQHPKHCLKINCQLVEPTPKAFLHQLQTLVNSDNNLKSIRDSITPESVLILDQFESFTLIESWLRRTFMPSMLGRLKLILSGRMHPDKQWVINPPDNAQFLCIKINSLRFNDAVRYLQALGHTKVVAMGINQFANGHPLALQLASSAVLEESERQLNQIPPNDVVETLVHYFVHDIKDPMLRLALEATSIVRRINQSLLTAMLDVDDNTGTELYQQLSEIEFIEHRDDGLSLHDILKNVMSSNLKAHHPMKYCQYRSRACKILQREMKSASASQLWRYTADIIYLVENSVIRSAFFPSFNQREYSVEPAIESDKESIMNIVSRYEPSTCVGIYSHWWNKQINAFHCVKNSHNETVGFYCLIKPDDVPTEWLNEDPVTAIWHKHLSAHNSENYSHHSIFVRRWLSENEGEALSGVQAACWLDIKRTYLEMRPNLRRVYLVLNNLQPYAPVATELGFQVLDLNLEIEDTPYYSAMLDMGPDSVDGWISKRLINEINHEQSLNEAPSWFDKNARQLYLHGDRTDLTPLEFGTLELLINNQGSVLSRKALLKQVWGIEYEGSSNVVDTIIRSLRRKLAEKSELIQAVRGVGYRFIRDC